MSEYLSKEEIKQWRSSLEKITLEEYAARLGKKIEEAKPTNDLIDIVLKGKPVISDADDYKQTRTERLSSIAERAFEREQEISPSPFSAYRIMHEDTPVKVEKHTKPKQTTKSQAKKSADKTSHKQETAKAQNLRDEVRIVFKKALTDREQKVFDHFVEHKNTIVYAKDLANLLDLPRDYVYKYIKNLRAKIDGENLKNADKGGFILNI